MILIFFNPWVHPNKANLCLSLYLLINVMIDLSNCQLVLSTPRLEILFRDFFPIPQAFIWIQLQGNDTGNLIIIINRFCSALFSRIWSNICLVPTFLALFFWKMFFYKLWNDLRGVIKIFSLRLQGLNKYFDFINSYFQFTASANVLILQEGERSEIQKGRTQNTEIKVIKRCSLFHDK